MSSNTPEITSISSLSSVPQNQRLSEEDAKKPVDPKLKTKGHCNV